LTSALLIAILLVFWYELSLGRQLGGFLDRWGLVPAEFLQALRGDPRALGALITPLTAAFLHAGWAHLLGNLLFLWFFGHLAESALGRARFTILFVAAGCAAAAAHVAGAPGATTPAIGASGATAGLIGGYVPLRLGAGGLRVSRGTDLLAALLLVVWLATALIGGALQAIQSGSESTAFSWWGHVAGFATGVVLVSLFRFVR
jgi:membrane associated rhomboid family serine protease